MTVTGLRQRAPRQARVSEASTFRDFRLTPTTLATLDAQGVTEPFAIQAATMPDALDGRDILGRGRTGSGKTLAYGLPLIERTAGSRARPHEPLALILVPTRELAQQVSTALRPYAQALRLRTATVVGGVAYGGQLNALRKGVDVLVATPGRLTDLVERGECRLDAVNIAVVDEADQMADIGFLPQVRTLLRLIPEGGQRMLFSATLDKDVDKLVAEFLQDPVAHSVDAPTATITTMAHHLLHVATGDKQPTVTEIAARDGRVLMFVETKHKADRLTDHFLRHGLRAVSLHGGKSQGQRTRALDSFKAGNATVLVATNVAARGIHVDDLDLVVNVDPPVDPKDYLHRGGRTARAGRSGTVVTMVQPHERRRVTRMMADAGIQPGSATVEPGHPELERITGSRTAVVASAQELALITRQMDERPGRPTRTGNNPGPAFRRAGRPDPRAPRRTAATRGHGR